MCAPYFFSTSCLHTLTVHLVGCEISAKASCVVAVNHCSVFFFFSKVALVKGPRQLRGLGTSIFLLWNIATLTSNINACLKALNYCGAVLVLRLRCFKASYLQIDNFIEMCWCSLLPCAGAFRSGYNSSKCNIYNI